MDGQRRPSFPENEYNWYSSDPELALVQFSAGEKEHPESP
jgi:hypothetical protein